MFGWGRRYCMGHELAADELYVFAMHLIWNFEIRLTPAGAVEVENDLVPGEKKGGHQWPRTWDQGLIIMQPEKLEVEFHVRRGKEGEVAIQEAYEDARSTDCLRQFGRVNVE